MKNKKLQKEEFLEILHDVFRIIKKEEKIKIIEETSSNLVVIGDLHGDIASLEKILKNINFESDKLLFLGDYGDRRWNDIEVYFKIFKLKLEHPSQIILLRGNHEGPSHLLPYPHDLPIHFLKEFGDNEAYLKLRKIWDVMPIASIVPGKYLFLHGGITSKLKELSDITKDEFLEAILWSDPYPGNEEIESPRGAGILFPEKTTKDVLERFKLKILIRSHQCCDPFRIDHDGKVLTIFSTKGEPYPNTHASFLRIPLKETFKNSNELVKKCLHVF